MIKLIIADDEKTIREGLKKALLSSGLHLSIPETAGNGIDALNLIEKHRPQIVLMDITMPGMVGLDVIEKGKAFVPDAKFIIISGHDDFHFAQRAVKLGAFDYLLKPIKRETLYEVVQRAIALLSANEERNILTSAIISESNNSIVQKSLSYINENFNDSELSLNMLAEKFHISQSYLTRIIKKETGTSFSEYLLTLRIEEAKKLLVSENELSVGQISELIGFSSHHYFSRVFKSATGISPIEYKQSAISGK